MSNKQNAESIVDKLLSYLREAKMEDGQKNDLISKIAYLGENFAPDQAWYVRTMNKVFELGGDFISQDLINKFIFRLTDIDEEIIKIYVKILKKS